MPLGVTVIETLIPREFVCTHVFTAPRTGWRGMARAPDQQRRAQLASTKARTAEAPSRAPRRCATKSAVRMRPARSGVLVSPDLCLTDETFCTAAVVRPRVQPSLLSVCAYAIGEKHTDASGESNGETTNTDRTGHRWRTSRPTGTLHEPANRQGPDPREHHRSVEASR